MCTACCCSENQIIIADAADEAACEQFLDSGVYGCGNRGGNEADALADCASGSFDAADWDPWAPCEDDEWDDCEPEYEEC